MKTVSIASAAVKSRPGPRFSPDSSRRPPFIMRVLPMAQKHVTRAPLLAVLAVLAFVVLLADRVLLQVRSLATPQPPQLQPVEARLAPPTSGTGSFATQNTASVPQYARAEKNIPACAKDGSRAKSFLVVFQSRSGSTAICTELRQHSEVYMDMMEMLDQIDGLKRSNVSGALAETRKFFRNGIDKGLVPGFKIRPHNIMAAPEEWAKLAAEFDTRIIWQYRKNIVKSSLGTYAATFLDDFTAIGGIKRKDAVGDRCNMGVGCKYKVENMTGFHEILRKRLFFEREIMKGVNVLDASGTCTLELPYEDYLYHSGDTMHGVQRFLGIKHENNQPARIKATKDSLCDVVENFDELCTNFYGCSVWQPYFDDMVNNCRCSRFANSPAEFCDTYFAGF